MKTLLLAAAFLAVPPIALAQPTPKTTAIPTISGVVHLEGFGDRVLVGGEWAGTKGESRRMEGIALRLSDTQGALRIEYLCHLQEWGDIGHVTEGVFCGTSADFSHY